MIRGTSGNFEHSGQLVVEYIDAFDFVHLICFVFPFIVLQQSKCG